MSDQQLIVGDFIEWMRGAQWSVQNGFLPKAHAIIADPPYFLGSIAKTLGGKNAAPAKFGKDGSFNRLSRGFMGKKWDGFDDVWQYQAWVTEWASLLLDYVYPGAILAMFGGTRTYHRLAAGLEDAGWDVFDCMMYIYGTGFPKAADIGKLIDKSEGVEREIIGTTRGRSATAGSMLDDDNYVWKQSFPVTSASTPNAQRFDGYKTALKPAFEPIVLARAPRGKEGYADLALNYGTGALNIDGCRIPYTGDTDSRTFGGSWKTDKGGKNVYELGFDGDEQSVSPLGRYPANLLLDEAAAVLLDAQSGNSQSNDHIDHEAKQSGQVYGWAKSEKYQRSTGYTDSGGASRFFYTSKASSWEREVGLTELGVTPRSSGAWINNPDLSEKFPDHNPRQRRNTHPTVKPIRLISYLASLLLPPVLDVPRRILVPFAGSGSEMIGCELAGWDEVVGIEREAEYCAINEARRRWWSGFTSYEDAEKDYKRDHHETAAERADRENKQSGDQLDFFGEMMPNDNELVNTEQYALFA